MKIKNILHFFVQIIMYICIVLMLYVLYTPLNKDPKNGMESSVQFIYQQF